MPITINGTTGIAGVDGSAATPALQGTDTNTGISFGSDVIIGSTGGVERWRTDSSGRVLVGTSSTVRSGLLEVAKATADTQIQITESSDSGEGPTVRITRTRGSNLSSPSPVQNANNLGRIVFDSYDTTAYRTGAEILAVSDGQTWASGDCPTRLVFSTCKDGQSSPTERLRLDQAGNTWFYNSPAIVPQTDNVTLCGAQYNRWSAVWAVNGTIQTSDQRAKADILDSSLGSNFIRSLRPVSYKWIEGGKRPTGELDKDNNYIYESVPGTRTHWGFIAQEVKQAVDAAGVDFGGWVLTDKDDPDSQQALRYDQFIAPLTKALQEALHQIDELKAEVNELKAKLP